MRLITLCLLAAATSLAADSTGKWSGTIQVPDRTVPAYLVLKQEGTTLTGTAGPSAENQNPIRNGKVEDGKLSFEAPAGNATMKFVLEQKGDELAGDVTRDRDGQTETAKIQLKREAASAASPIRHLVDIRYRVRSLAPGNAMIYLHLAYPGSRG